MPQVSKFMIRPEVWDRIFNMFLDSFLFAKDKNKLNAYIQSIFTPTERIMFAKRFAACILLAKGHDYRSVARTLRMSLTTISKMNFKLRYEGEGLMPIIEDTFRKQAKLVVKEEIKDLFDFPTKSSLKSHERAKRVKGRRKKIESIKSEF
ncbi:MAG: Trp family transcriptional regulator [Patescibacteria group bacterium]